MSEMVDLWCEGYAATGERAPATFLGSFKAGSIDEAVERWVEQAKPDEGLVAKQGGVWRYWGCRIFDNEADARKAFG
jgi:hypothetical protein